MKIQRITFLADILERELSETHQLMIVNEYNSAKDYPLIYINDEDGLDELLGHMSAFDILRASNYGHYDFTEPFVFINAHGNLETTDDVCRDWSAVAEWMIDGGYANCFDAWDILNNVSYVEIGDFENDFLNEFPYRINEDEEIVKEWFEYADYTLSYLFLTSWEDLKDEFNEWKNENNK